MTNPSSKTNSTSQQQPPLTPQQEIAQLRQQYQAVSELLWETIHTLAPETHEAVVLPHASNPLWELCFVRVEAADGKPDPSGKMRICAATVPEITEQEKKRVVRFLRGTDRPIEDAIAEFKLAFPATYLEAKIADRIRWKAYGLGEIVPGVPSADGGQRAALGIWESVTPPTIAEKVKNAVNWPK